MKQRFNVPIHDNSVTKYTKQQETSDRESFRDLEGNFVEKPIVDCLAPSIMQATPPEFHRDNFCRWPKCSPSKQYSKTHIERLLTELAALMIETIVMRPVSTIPYIESLTTQQLIQTALKQKFRGCFKVVQVRVHNHNYLLRLFKITLSHVTSQQVNTPGHGT